MPDDPVPSDPVPLSKEALKTLLAQPITSITLNDLKQLGIVSIDPDKQPHATLPISKTDLEALSGLVADKLNAMSLTTTAVSVSASKAVPKVAVSKKGVAKTVAAKKAAAKKTVAKTSKAAAKSPKK